LADIALEELELELEELELVLAEAAAVAAERDAEDTAAAGWSAEEEVGGKQPPGSVEFPNWSDARVALAEELEDN
jgi:hypothetical protein